MILAESRDNHSCNVSIMLRNTSSIQHLGASATCEQFDRHVADVPALDCFQMMCEQLQTPVCHHCCAFCCRSYFPESVWSQIDKLFPRGSQPVAYDIAIGTGRGAIELAKRQDICHLCFIDQLIHDNAEGPPVNSTVMALTVDDLLSMQHQDKHKVASPCA